MSEAIIVALIAAGGSIVCQIILSKKSKKESDFADAMARQKINDRLDAIEKKIDIHNGYAEKFGEIQQDIAVLKAEVLNLKTT